MHKNAQVMGTTMRSRSITRRRSSTTTRRCSSGRDPTAAADLGRVAGRCQKLTDESTGQWGIMLPSTNDDSAAGSSRRWCAPTAENTLTKLSGRGLLQLADHNRRPALLADLIYKDKVMPSGVLNSKQITPRSSPASSGWRCSAPARWAYA